MPEKLAAIWNETLTINRNSIATPVAGVAGRRQLRSASRELLNFPRYNMSNCGRRAFCFAGPYVWNSLPEHIRQSTSIASSAHQRHFYSRWYCTYRIRNNNILLFYGLYKCTDLLLITYHSAVSATSEHQYSYGPHCVDSGKFVFGIQP